jgi:hypothetical protein
MTVWSDAAQDSSPAAARLQRFISAARYTILGPFMITWWNFVPYHLNISLFLMMSLLSCHYLSAVRF